MATRSNGAAASRTPSASPVDPATISDALIVADLTVASPVSRDRQGVL